MNILLLTNEYSHPLLRPTGGIGVFYRDYAKELSKDNNVFVYSFTNIEHEEKCGNLCLNFSRSVMKNNFVRKLISKSYIITLPILFPFVLFNMLIQAYKIKLFCEKNNIEIIESPDYEGISALLKFTGVKSSIVIRTHGANTTLAANSVGKLSWIMSFFERRSIKKSDGVIFISKASRYMFEDVFGKYNKESTICYNGIADTVKHPDLGRKSLKVCNFGTISIEKGVDEYLNIADILKIKDKNIEFHLAGRMTKPLKYLVKNSRAVKYHGIIEKENINKFISQFDVFVFPSKLENCPLSWAEVMAQGKIVLSSNILVAKEFIDDGSSGYICNSELEFVDRLRLIKDDKKLFETLSRNSFILYKKKFEYKEMINNSIKFYKRVINIE